jgi:hypothetical protein
MHPDLVLPDLMPTDLMPTDLTPDLTSDVIPSV